MWEDIVGRQIRRWNLERAAIAEGEQRQPRAQEGPLRPVITLSRDAQSGGEEVAALLAKRLGYEVFDRQIVERIAASREVSQEVITSLDEHTRPRLEVWVEGILSAHLVEHDDYIRDLTRIIRAVAAQGGVVILGRGATFILEDVFTFDVRIVARRKWRAKQVMEEERIGQEEACRRLTVIDAERRMFIKKYFNREINDSRSYDLVINRERFAPPQAVELILDALRHSAWPVKV